MSHKAMIVCDTKAQAAGWARHDYGAVEVVKVETRGRARNGRNQFLVTYETLRGADPTVRYPEGLR